jgi:uncharacterized protein YecE (DUF72 family)
MARVFVATAGWSIPREHAPTLPSLGSALQRYASILGATEINSTFSRRHRATTFERWCDSVPESFRFAVKVPRAITHEAELRSPRPALTEFFEDLAGLRHKLGPILVQLPASAPFEARRVANFFRVLRTSHAGPVACEPRHASWYTPRASSLLSDHQVARVAADPPRPKDAQEPGGAASLRYFRWHGSPRTYWSEYGEERLKPLVDRVRREPEDTTVWCVFDNTASGAALGDALRFLRLMAPQ